MKLLKLWEKIGKQPLKNTQYTDLIITSGDKKLFVTNIEYVNGKFVSLHAEEICCKTCKNNPKYNNGYAPPHTCDICTSLDQEEEHEMWGLSKWYSEGKKLYDELMKSE